MEGERKVTVEGMIGEKFWPPTGCKKVWWENQFLHLSMLPNTCAGRAIGVKGSVTEKKTSNCHTQLKSLKTIHFSEQKLFRLAWKETRNHLLHGPLNASWSEIQQSELQMVEIIHVGAAWRCLWMPVWWFLMKLIWTINAWSWAKEVVVVEGCKRSKAVNKFYSTAKGKVVSKSMPQTTVFITQLTRSFTVVLAWRLRLKSGNS